MTAGIEVDAAVEDERWSGPLGDAEAFARRAAEAALAVAPQPGLLAFDILFADDAALRALNRDWRGKDRPTNVLSFPAPPMPGAGVRHLGDVALAYETVEREAGEEGRSLPDHATHLVIHGLLHLLGHDHEEEAEAERMEALEVAALARLGIADPYA